MIAMLLTFQTFKGKLFYSGRYWKTKGRSCKKSFTTLNNSINIETYVEAINRENVLKIIDHYDIVLDGTDNFETRHLEHAKENKDKPLVFGSIFKFEGQITVFNYKNGPSYRCLYPEPKEGEVPNTRYYVFSVLGLGIIGTIKRNEALKTVL